MCLCACLRCVHANNSWCSTFQNKRWGPLSLILSLSQQCKQLTLMFISVDRERKMREVTMVSSVSLWHSLNDCFKFSSINSPISSQPSLQSTECLLKDSDSLCHDIFFLTDHYQFKIHICTPVITHADDIQIHHPTVFFYFILTVCGSFSLSMKIHSSVIVHDI